MELERKVWGGGRVDVVYDFPSSPLPSTLMIPGAWLIFPRRLFLHHMCWRYYLDGSYGSSYRDNSGSVLESFPLRVGIRGLRA